MKIYSVPGVNGLGRTKGVEKSFLKVLEGIDFEGVDVNSEDIKEQLKDIYLASRKFVGEKFFVLGGDHSISYPIVKAFFEKYGKDSRLLVFDSHPDLMEPMPEPSHEEWLRAVIELGFDVENILLVGVRRESENIDEVEINYAKEKGVKIIYSDEFVLRKQEILDFVSFGKVYVSFDVDVFDSSIVGATGYPEKNGLGEEVFDLLKEIRGKIFGFDLVEYNSELDEEDKSLKVVRRVLGVFGYLK